MFRIAIFTFQAGRYAVNQINIGEFFVRIQFPSGKQVADFSFVVGNYHWYFCHHFGFYGHRFARKLHPKQLEFIGKQYGLHSEMAMGAS
jgi:hypothetical protein